MLTDLNFDADFDIDQITDTPTTITNLMVQNPNAYDVWLILFNVAEIGSVVPPAYSVICVPAGNGNGSYGTWYIDPTHPWLLDQGLAYAVSDAPDSLINQSGYQSVIVQMWWR